MIDANTIKTPEIAPVMHDITIKNIKTTATDSMSVGGANSVKVNALHAIVRNLTIDGITYRGSTHGHYVRDHKSGTGSPVAVLSTAAGGIVEDVNIANVNATNSMGMIVVASSEPGRPVRVQMQNISLLNCYAPSAAIHIYSTQPPTGTDEVSLTNFTIAAAPEALAQGHPVGVNLLPTQSRQNGIGGRITRESRSDPRLPDADQRLRYDDRVAVDDVKWDTGRPTFNRFAGVRVTNSSPY